MKPLEELTCRVTFQRGIVVVAALIALALSSAVARRVEPSMHAAAPAATVAAPPAARSAKETRGASPYLEIRNEPPAKLIVDPPLPDLLDQGIVFIQWRAENVHIVPVVGKAALNASPRVGHLHVHVDDLPWLWADASDINTIDLAGVPPGPHKVLIELVNANHEVFPGQSKTVTFTVGSGAPHSHSH
jgi:Family of unknown function (DUF6130)